MSYQTKSIIGPIIDFIKTCPFLDEFNIDIQNIDTQKFSTDEPPGTSVEYNGSVVVSRMTFVVGSFEQERQMNLTLWLARQSNDNVYRTETADFLSNFEEWVDYCQSRGTTPKFGDEPDSEIMWAENGMYFSEWDEEKKASLYMVQLHIQYKKYYEMEES